MPKRHKSRIDQLPDGSIKSHQIFGSMRGTGKILGDVVSPAWDGPWDAELDIAYRGENGKPIHYTGNGIETEDDLH